MIKRNDGISKDDICQNQFTAYVVLAVKRKRQSYIKKKQRDNEKENRTKKEAEQSEFRTAGYDMWSRMEPQNEKLMAAMQQLSLKERFVVTEYALKGKPFKEIAQETGLKEKGVASAYYRSIKKLRAEMGDAPCAVGVVNFVPGSSFAGILGFDFVTAFNGQHRGIRFASAAGRGSLGRLFFFDRGGNGCILKLHKFGDRQVGSKNVTVHFHEESPFRFQVLL